MRFVAIGSILALTAAPALACGPNMRVPPPGQAIDRHLAAPPAQDKPPARALSASERSRALDIRSRMAAAIARGDEADARRLEDDAMAILGFRRVWLRCGPGTHTWEPLKPTDGARSS